MNIHMLLEYLSKGSLHEYLRSLKGGLGTGAYQNMDVMEGVLSLQQKLTWVADIARGMEFLASKRV